MSGDFIRFDCDFADADALSTELANVNLGWETMAYIYTVFIVCFNENFNGTTMGLCNPIHGLVHWWLVENFFCHGVKQGYFVVPGISEDDAGEGGGLSSYDRVLATSKAKIACLLAACARHNHPVPSLGTIFFQLFGEFNDDGTPVANSPLNGEAHTFIPSLDGEAPGGDDIAEEDAEDGADS
jgi:hypothetical protein